MLVRVQASSSLLESGLLRDSGCGSICVPEGQVPAAPSCARDCVWEEGPAGVPPSRKGDHHGAGGVDAEGGALGLPAPGPRVPPPLPTDFLAVAAPSSGLWLLHVLTSHPCSPHLFGQKCAFQSKGALGSSSSVGCKLGSRPSDSGGAPSPAPPLSLGPPHFAVTARETVARSCCGCFSNPLVFFTTKAWDGTQPTAGGVRVPVGQGGCRGPLDSGLPLPGCPHRMQPRYPRGPQSPTCLRSLPPRCPEMWGVCVSWGTGNKGPRIPSQFWGRNRKSGCRWGALFPGDFPGRVLLSLPLL